MEIKKSHRGLFTEFAENNGMSVAEAARHVMANKDQYSPSRVKQANFAKNAEGWHHADGGEVEGYATGGNVGGGDYDAVLNEIRQQKAAEQAKREKTRSYYAAQIQTQNDANAKAELQRQAREASNASLQKESVLNYKRGQIEKLYNQYKSAPETVSESFDSPKSKYAGSLQKAIVDYKDTYNKYNPGEALNSNESAPAGQSKPAKFNYLTGKTNPITQYDNAPVNKAIPVPSAATLPAPVQSNRNIKISQPATPNVAFSPTEFANNDPEVNVPVNNPAVSSTTPAEIQAKSAADTADAYNKQQAQNAILDQYLPKTTPNNPNAPAPTAKKGFNLDNIIGGVVQYGLPIAQAAIGIRGLQKAGNRPVDHIDPDFVNAIGKTENLASQANVAAQYGLSPDQIAQARMDNLNATNSSRAFARNIAGDNAATAFNLERAANNDMYGRNLATRVADNNMKLQKQQIAADRQNNVNNILWDKQNYNRMLFGDTMNAFQQKQSANAGLINAGVSNLLDSYYSNKRLNNYDNLMSQSNPYKQ